MKQKFKEYFKKRNRKKIPSRNIVKNEVNYVTQPPYGAEGTRLTPGST